ncbi:hypothetical protein CEXT_498571 [Caerostris extrusa]|uniref:Secreted protein n=1 Tax=Caerostris extrusa TaxID=172846 RepID=A0AAV4TJT6_CAEEX|nr:hypothetical protein CEXT_498571 [Caerostris extrusa]
MPATALWSSLFTPSENSAVRAAIVPKSVPLLGRFSSKVVDFILSCAIKHHHPRCRDCDFTFVAMRRTQPPLDLR